MKAFSFSWSDTNSGGSYPAAEKPELFLVGLCASAFFVGTISMTSKEEKNFFVVEGFHQLSQTFVRTDFDRVSGEGEWDVLDILDYKVGLMSGKSEILLVIAHAVFFFIRRFTKVAPLLLGSKWRAVVHALLLYVIIRLRRGSFASVTHLKGHFLGKCALVSYFFHLTDGCSFTVVCHGSDLYSSPRSFNRILAAAERIECVTYFGKGFVYGRLGALASGRTFLERNVIIRERNADYNKTFSVNNILCVTVCRLVPQKDIEFALRVVAEIKKMVGGTVQFHIIGDGPSKLRLMRLVASLDLEDVVQFLGPMDNISAQSRIALSDFFILPCLEGQLMQADGLPVVFQEALSLGVPVFCRKSYGVSELCVSEVNGYAFDVADPPDYWATKILETVPCMDRSEIARLSRYQF